MNIDIQSFKFQFIAENLYMVIRYDNPREKYIKVGSDEWGFITVSNHITSVLAHEKDTDVLNLWHASGRLSISRAVFGVDCLIPPYIIVGNSMAIQVLYINFIYKGSLPYFVIAYLGVNNQLGIGVIEHGSTEWGKVFVSDKDITTISLVESKADILREWLDMGYTLKTLVLGSQYAKFVNTSPYLIAAL